MKNVLAVLFAILLCLPLSSCQTAPSHSVTAESKSVQLTLYNYEDYLDISARAKCGDNLDIATEVICSVDISGNSKYEYNNVSLVVEFPTVGFLYGTQRCYINLNLSGKGSKSCTFTVRGSDRDKILQGTTFKVISISGTVTKN